MKAYQTLCDKFQTISHIRNAQAILGWDNNVMMPRGSYNDRASQQATLGSIAHQMITSGEVKDLLDQAEQIEQNTLDDWAKSNLRLMRNEWIHNNAVEENLLKEFTMAASECEMNWRTAKANNDFKSFAIYWKKLVNLSRIIADSKAEALGLSRYDALLDQYDQGNRSANIDKIFTDLKSFLPGFIDDVISKQQGKKPPVMPTGVFPTEIQRQLSLEMMAVMGFDFNKGRLDVSAHPFSGGTSDDVRITTRYDETNYTKCAMSVFHETGHALYSSGEPAAYRGQPVGNSLGMSIHESQSLLMEMQVCRSHDFLKFFEGYTKRYFGDNFGNSAENLYNIYNWVEPSFIRVDADEVTYPVHVIMRYEIEKQLIEGTIEINDVPDLWNKKIKDMLGLTVPSDTKGCLQDIHWADGTFGYYPSYTLGAMGAAQFYIKAKKDMPQLPEQISKGNFTNLVSWLRKNIHSQGCRYTAPELFKVVTGETLNPEIYKNYLKQKYLS